MTEIPYGYCHCGCGERTRPSRGNARLGVIKGQPAQYKRGHSNRGQEVGTCSIAGCTGRHAARGLCKRHYYRRRRSANPQKISRDRAPITTEWMLEQTVENAAGCFEWQRALCRDGYGKVRPTLGTRGAHRTMYILVNGPIPDGLTVDHLCFNRRCINPAHLRLLTPEDNARRRLRTIDASDFGTPEFVARQLEAVSR